MNQEAADFIVATRAALTQASALAVHYSFSIVGAVIILVIGWLFAGVLQRWAYRGLEAIHGIDETLARFFSNLLRYVVLILVFITVLGQFGVQTASIIATLGAAGLAVGLALQGTLQNIAAGIMLLVLRPFRVGEYIETSSVSGTVEEIGLFATELRTPEGLYRLAPNSTLWNTPVTNYSRRALRRHEISVPVAAGDDVKGVERQLLALARAQGTTENSPPPETFISDLTAANATVTLRYWVRNADWDRVTSRMREAVRNDIFGRKDAA
ncbi:MAG: mechanosensitive ion channel family protein [Rhizobiales bacterium]|nr:mechanosensitive ion channel family protein [Hyphomicrobiales bacterium]